MKDNMKKSPNVLHIIMLCENMLYLGLALYVLMAVTVSNIGCVSYENEASKDTEKVHTQEEIIVYEGESIAGIPNNVIIKTIETAGTSVSKPLFSDASQEQVSEETVDETEDESVDETEDKTGEETAVNGEQTDVVKESTESRARELNVSCILQNPELPTGCEITSLAIVLNHLGIVADKCYLADNYLDKGPAGYTLPYEAFIGNPRSETDSFGCYSPVIVKCANKYLEDIGSIYRATDLSGSRFEDLLSEIDASNPVIVWATINMDKPYYSVTWNINGKEFRWKRREHCLVLTGYDYGKGIVYVSDPMKGNVAYPFDVFKERYEDMYSQAIVIK